MLKSRIKKCLAGAMLLTVSQSAWAIFPSSQPYNGVKYWHETRQDPAMSLHFVQIDLSNKNLAVKVSPAGPDPDGAGEWQTILMPPGKIADREGFDVCVNASFFSARSTKDAEGEKSGFVAGKWSSAVGLTMTDGKLWSTEVSEKRPTFWMDRSGGAHLGQVKSLPANATQAAQGFCFVLKQGATIEPVGMMLVRHPRTVIGLDKQGKTLTLLAVDGRQKNLSIGMTGPELGEEMKKVGCVDAVNLDGGGSTELVLRDPETGLLHVMNKPSDGRERAVADVIGISVKGALRTPTTKPIMEK